MNDIYNTVEGFIDRSFEKGVIIDKKELKKS